MKAKHSLLMQRIVESLNIDYGIDITRLTPLLLGADIDASLYKAQTAEQHSYFVKIKRGNHHDAGVAILALLHHEGIQEVILPIKNSIGQMTNPIDAFTLIVYPFMEHQNGFSQNLTDDQWMILGKVLRKVHGCKIPQEIQSKIRTETYSSKWREIVRSFYGYIDGNPTGDELAVKLLLFMKKHKEDIHRLVERAEFFCQEVNQKSADFVLCHGDIHGGNVLITANHSIYIVDWDDPIMAPKERDLMFIGGGVANVWNNPHEEDCFYKGYGKTEINNSLLAYYRHERIVEDIAIYAQELLLRADRGDARAEMYKHFIGMFEPRGVIDIAFKTDEYLANSS